MEIRTGSGPYAALDIRKGVTGAVYWTFEKCTGRASPKTLYPSNDGNIGGFHPPSLTSNPGYFYDSSLPIPTWCAPAGHVDETLPHSAPEPDNFAVKDGGENAIGFSIYKLKGRADQLREGTPRSAIAHA